jgi:hypothetical protein
VRVTPLEFVHPQISFAQRVNKNTPAMITPTGAVNNTAGAAIVAVATLPRSESLQNNLGIREIRLRSPILSRICKPAHHDHGEGKDKHSRNGDQRTQQQEPSGQSDDDIASQL